MTERCGYVAILGRPNAGKSTLFNALTGHKLASVSAKPQTTRGRILGVCTEGQAQLLFLDTPGMHNPAGKPKLNSVMNKVAWGVAADADLIAYLIPADSGWLQEDADYLQNLLRHSTAPILVLATKIDSAKHLVIQHGISNIREGWRAMLTLHPDIDVKGRMLADVPYGVSAKRPESVRKLRDDLFAEMPEGPWLFPKDGLTDLPQQAVCGELIREQLFRQLDQEIPYGCAVKIETMHESPKCTSISSSIIVSRANHKAMVIGKGGMRIKSIGTKARLVLERHLGGPVFLELNVKVENDWINDARLIADYEMNTNL